MNREKGFSILKKLVYAIDSMAFYVSSWSSSFAGISFTLYAFYN